MIDNKLSILIIDDDEVDRIALKRSIKSSGFNADIISVCNKAEGLEALSQKTFDCIFLDYNLPDSNGLDFLKNHRSELNGAPVIIVTSHGDEKLAVEAMRMGACDYIPKNLVTPEGISQSIRYALRINAAQQNTSKAERALQESERKLETVIAKSPIILFAINKDGQFSMFKGRGVELLNVNPEDIIGKNFIETHRILPIDIKSLRNVIGGKELSTTMEVNNRFLDITCIPQRDEFFEPSGMIGIATDITDLKNSEIELKNNLSIAQETQKVKEQFLANMSHEIRTPIHGIMSLTNLLIKTNIDNDQMTYLNAIKKSADNLLVIINDILDLSKIEAQKMTFESTIFSASELVSTTFELFRAKANEKGIEIIKNIDDCIPEYVKGDPTRLSQIINNLVNNAIKFTHKGGVEIGVKLVDTNENCSMIAFSIKDSGIGISQNKLSTIFDMFTQAGDDITRKYGGTGLGLSIAKKLVDLQGGIIKVDSVIDEGTTFTFSMPFDHPDPIELEAHHSQSEEPESRIDSELRILIVEDNDINRLVINKIMKDWGVKLDNAVNGVDAIDKMKAKDYDIILLDIEMPEMNGYQCIREIRTALPEPKCHVSVMAMTAHANKKERDKCIGLGMDDYISKPFDPLDLKQKIVALSKKSLGGTCEVEPVIEEKAPAAAPTQKLTNLDYLRELSDNNESFFKDFISLFLNNTPETMAELEKQLSGKNWEGVRQAAHKMKPSLNYLGLKEAQGLAASVEEYALKKENLEKIEGMVTRLKEICNAAYSELEQELKSLPIA
ncbi:MAG: Autoinducer 2 sensor kinase/phosphatase LuxQ [Bacteroidetes bacterium ADurb.Bin397]|nr:MAG: Autoinducer 2 sensor kinase/phosphatase LuxQ [Bacteroidetes bacterium ADurb.Bin397]